MHLLILDDDSRVAQFMARVANSGGWSTDVAGDEAAFQSMFSERRPDAIMLDLQLGRSDGVEQLRFLHRAGFAGPIALISGFDIRVLDAAQRIGEALGLKIAAVIEKPARLTRVQEVLQAMAAHGAAHGTTETVAPPSGSLATPPDIGVISPERISAAIAGGEMELYLQPIVAASDLRVTRAEGLVRWRHPTAGLLGPDGFVAVAEQHQPVIDALTRWVIGAAVAQHGRLAAHGHDIQICVNVSGSNLHALDFPDQVAGLLEQLGAPATAIGLEVTESVAMRNPDATADILTRLRLKGITLAIDDFGVGHSSLAVLRHMPFSTLKIDKSFIGDLATAHDSQMIVATTIQLARSMGLATVAEGVENETVADLLSRLGIGGLQGYYFSAPLPLEDFVTWLDNWSARTPLVQHA